jgi:hypothetical protein
MVATLGRTAVSARIVTDLGRVFVPAEVCSLTDLEGGACECAMDADTR